MSEFQCICFRAVDGPVSEKNLEYMEKQSSRAEITPWSFDNEYHFGDFHGNAPEMLRRGYDFHLHYANFGTRTLMIRLPAGLPDAEAARPDFETESFWFVKDKNGSGGHLEISPSYEPDTLEQLWELDDVVDGLLPIRAENLSGDLRPLYLADLAIMTDINHDPEESMEPPVPAGLNKLTKAQTALAQFYGINGLIAAAATKSPGLPASTAARSTYEAWLATQPEKLKNAWLNRIMSDPGADVRRELLASYGKSHPPSSWPTVTTGRTIAESMATAEEMQKQKRSGNQGKKSSRREQMTSMSDVSVGTPGRPTNRLRSPRDQKAGCRDARDLELQHSSAANAPTRPIRTPSREPGCPPRPVPKQNDRLGRSGQTSRPAALRPNHL